MGTSMRDRALPLRVDSIVRSLSAKASALFAWMSVMTQISPVRNRRSRMEEGFRATRWPSWLRDPSPPSALMLSRVPPVYSDAREAESYACSSCARS